MDYDFFEFNNDPLKNNSNSVNGIEKSKATIYDFEQMCNNQKNCTECPMNDIKLLDNDSCLDKIRNQTDLVNDCILKWKKDNIINRQNKFISQFPNVTLKDGIIDICPNQLDYNFSENNNKICGMDSCSKCKMEFWLSEMQR